ncbi:MAG: hypothetical protein HY908_20275 [Myxococcales bacterium]|nr:hypothetical protein [Myxococcales bacterium]
MSDRTPDEPEHAGARTATADDRAAPGARRLILGRRARFLALAAAGLAPGCEDASPRPCLEPPIERDGGPTTAPTPCLTVAPSPPVTSPETAATPCLTFAPAPPDAGAGTTTASARPADAGPPAKHTTPRPCLTVTKRPEPWDPSL